MEKSKITTQDKETQDALILKRIQDKVRKKFDYLGSVDAQYFQAKYLKAQAKEICDYLQYLRLTPFRSWYSKHLEMVSDPMFMFDHCLVKNEFEEIVPDLVRINSFILKEPSKEDRPYTEGRPPE